MNKVRVRFAPSPTGPLHIGGARSALFNWLFARSRQGAMVVRIEDTDLERSTREYEELILESLRWLGLDWDEGIGAGGNNGPYRQKERLDIYRPYTERLLASGQAYPCFCGAEELEQERRFLLEKGDLPRYLGKCRNLSLQDKEEKCRLGIKPAVRFRVPEDRLLAVDDLVRGRVEFDSNGIGDFIIVKSDGIPTYNFAVVLDDILMSITHILRGEEHLSNTPRQLLIYEALGFEPPLFAHISLILGEDRSKMSKRHGSTSVAQYKEQGYLPEALVNFLALLGWSPEGEREIMPLAELVNSFSLDRVAKSPAVFNIEKLKWMNGHYIRALPRNVLTDLCLPYLVKEGKFEEDPSSERLEWLTLAVAAIQEKVEFLAQVPGLLQVFFGDTADLDPLDDEAGQVLALETSADVIRAFHKRTVNSELWDAQAVRQIFKETGNELNVKGKALYMTVRAAVSGRSSGPDLNTLLVLLGSVNVARRLEHTLKKM